MIEDNVRNESGSWGALCEETLQKERRSVDKGKGAHLSGLICLIESCKMTS